MSKKGSPYHNYPWDRTGKFLETKYPYIVHAELNAILSATFKLENSVIYVSLFPCNECAKAIIQSGIQTIIYEEDKYENTENNTAAKRMLGDANKMKKKLAFSGITKRFN
ncbi:deoxycytidylate deaminase [Spiroplasma endosymbiont of 'Nebria riversi']|uniref:deoxycytidylate deaminase n=1 Tax=Spiroplasma endosymbiont of 'Nebria riversi' TaxID=2792084 RepID=UPI001C046CB9|nr:deaminase [Spiroplasma endosymbiont of 'Nebria riversi']